MGTVQTIVVVLGLAATLLNLVASRAVITTPSLSPAKKSLQLALIWLLPLIGAASCLAILRYDDAPIPPPKPQDFIDPGLMVLARVQN